jgi:aldose 1-epimerase
MNSPRVFTLSDGGALQVRISDLGATWLSCRLALPGAAPRELLLGHAQASDSLHEPGYLGSTVGRYANRIGQACFVLDGQVHRLVPNEGRHQLHGGPDGFHRRPWQVLEAAPASLVLALHSPALDQGYPGALDVVQRYHFPEAGTLRVAWELRCDAACPVNLTQHAYFNLDGAPGPVHAHRLRVAARRRVEVDAELIPTGRLVDVAGGGQDFRLLRPLIEATRPQGHDDCWVLDAEAAAGRAPAAELWSSDGSVGLQLSTDLPGLQVYSGQHLAAARGRDGAPLPAQSGVALEPQHLPDHPNHPQWPGSCIVRPGQVVRHAVNYRFLAGPRR